MRKASQNSRTAFKKANKSRTPDLDTNQGSDGDKIGTLYIYIRIYRSMVQSGEKKSKSENKTAAAVLVFRCSPPEAVASAG